MNKHLYENIDVFYRDSDNKERSLHSMKRYYSIFDGVDKIDIHKQIILCLYAATKQDAYEISGFDNYMNTEVEK